MANLALDKASLEILNRTMLQQPASPFSPRLYDAYGVAIDTFRPGMVIGSTITVKRPVRFAAEAK